MTLTGGMGSLPTDIPSRAIDYRGKTYDVTHHVDVSDSGDQTDGLGQKDSSNANTTVTTETLYFHDRRMSREQTEMGERRVEKIESSAYTDVQLEANDRVTHDSVEWECQTVETRPTPDDPSFVRATWVNRDV